MRQQSQLLTSLIKAPRREGTQGENIPRMVDSFILNVQSCQGIQRYHFHQENIWNKEVENVSSLLLFLYFFHSLKNCCPW